MNAPEPEDRSVAERALKWVMCCRRPSSIETLVKAVSFDFYGNVDEEVDSDYLLDVCSNLIIVDHNQLVQFAHLSVRAHNQVARTSLFYLLAGGFQDGTDINKENELLDYTALYWP